MKKKRSLRSKIIRNKNYPFLRSFLFFLAVIVLLAFLVLFFLSGFTGRQIQGGTWRSSMFPSNWQPIDKIGAVEGINIFTDPNGTKDQNGNTVTSGPMYHPKRFLHDFSYAGYAQGEKPIPPEDLNPNWVDSAGTYMFW